MKRFLALFLPLLLLVGGLTVYLGVHLSQARLERLESRDAEQLQASARLLARGLERSLQQLQGLQREPALQRAFTAPPDQAHALVQASLESLLYRNSIYSQARWLGPDGIERVRLDRDGPAVVPVAQGELQDKSDRPYFTEAIRLAPGQFYLSALDLNVEHGQIEVPHRPMIRAAIRLPTLNGVDLGLLVINLPAEGLIDDYVASAPITRGQHQMLLNSRGGLLATPEQNDWSHLLERDDSLASRQPRVWQQMAASSSGQLHDASGLWTWSSVEPGQLWQGQIQAAESWKLVSHLDRDRVRERWWRDWPLLLLSGGIILLLLAFGVRRYSRLLSERDATAAELEAARALQQSQAELQKSLDLVALVEQSAGVGLWSWNMDLGPEHLHWSDQTFKLFGLDPATASASFDSWYQVVHPDDLPAAEAAIAESIRTHQLFAVTYRVVWPDGKIRWIDAFGHASYDEAGAPRHFSGLCLDVTERKKSEQALRDSERRFRDLFEYLPIAYQSLDAEGQWLDANQEMADLLGYESPAQMAGLSFAAHWTDASCAFDDCFADIKKERNFSGELQLRHRDGHLVTAIAHCRTQHDSHDKFLRTHAVLINLTDRLAMEQALRDLNATLERKVSERTAEIQLLAENASDVVFRASSSGLFEWVSPSVTALVGWLPEEMIGKSYTDFAHPDDWPAILAVEQRTQQGERVTFELRVPTRDGGIHWVSVSVKAVLDATGQVEARVGGWCDIQSEVVVREQLNQSRQQIEQALAEMTASEARFHAIFDQAPIGIALIDSHSGQIYECNASFASIVGRSIEAMSRLDWMNITHPDDIQPDLDNMARLNAGEVPGFQMNKRYLRPDGSVVWVRMTVARVQVDPHESPRHLAMVEDITEQRQIEQSLLAAKDEAEQASRAKSAFVANMSHEVRTPMNAVLGFLDILADSDLDAQQRTLVDKVQKSSRSLLRILNDILDFSKLDAGAVDLELAPFVLDEVLRDATDLLALTASAKGLELVLDVPPGLPQHYRGDALRLGQILVNLLGNAIKFTERGSIHLAVRARDQAHGQTSLRFEVTDSGIGLTPEQAQRLFQPFVQADSSTTRRFGGTGLGLTIAKRLVELMGGEIGVQSEPGRGSTFWFTVQLAPGEHVEPTLPPALKQERVLLVDDHDSVREILGRMMRAWGFAVDAVADANTALQCLRQAEQDDLRYSLLVLDWSMPGYDGLWLLRQLHEMTATNRMQRTPTVLMVTAYERLALVRAAAEGPVLPDAVLSKPITASRLFDTVQELQQRGFVRLPAAESIVLDPYRQASSIRGAELLLVEDSPTNQEVALAMLRKMGLQVTVASHGLEALQKLAERPYALVLMDLQMPVMDGFEATAAIRATSWGRSLPIIAMTAAAFADDRQRVLDAGMNDFVSKPVDSQQLLAALLRWLPHQQPAADMAADTAVDAWPAGAAVADAAAHPVPQAMLPAQLEGFALAQTLERLGQDPDLLLRVLRQFLHDFQPDEWAGQLDAALLDNDQPTAQRLVHTLLGVAGNVGAERLRAAALALERVLKDAGSQPGGDPALLQQRRNDCLAALRSATAVLQAGLPAAADNQTQAAQPEAALQDLAEMEQLLRRNRLVPAALLARLREHVGQHAAAAQLGQLREQIGVFDFKSALATLARMQELLQP